MNEEAMIREQIRSVPLIRYLSYGFLDPRIERDSFGIIVYSVSPDAKEGQLGEYRPAFFENTEVFNFRPRSFPIFVRSIKEKFHLGCNPTNGTGSCWAKSQISSNNPLGPGMLTVQHLVGTANKKIDLSCGIRAAILDRAPWGIDAMLLDTPCCSLAGNKMNPKQHIAPWTTVEFRGGVSGPISCQITDITNTQGVFSNAYLPIRIFIDSPGQPGDSGALVEIPASDPVGLYMGEYMSLSGVRGGFAQHLFQVTSIMDMEIYR
jgi:hypothetical protein